MYSKNLNKNCSLLLSFFLFYSFSFSQSGFEHYTAANGLAHDITYNIFQDSKGYIWIGTDDGLSKFDGQTFLNSTLENGLTSNYDTDIEQISQNKYAVATWGGGLHFVENDTIYKLGNFKDSSLKIYGIQNYKNNIYTETGYYFLVYDIEKKLLNRKIFVNSKGFTEETPKNDSIGLVKLSIIDDVKYIHDQNIYKNDVFGVKELNSDFEIKEVFPSLSKYKVGAISKKNGGEFFIGTGNDVIIFDGNNIIEKNKIHVIPEGDTIIKIIVAKNNELFLIAQNNLGYKTIYQYNLISKFSKNLVEELSIKTTISDAIIDFEENLWITAFGDGVYQYKYNSPEINSFLNGETIVDILEYKGNIYALSPSKLYKFNRNKELIDTFNIDGLAKGLSIVDNQLQVSSLNGKNYNFESEEFSLSHGTFFERINQGYIRQCDTIFFNKRMIANTNEISVKLVDESQDTIQFFTNKGKWNYLIREQKFEKDKIFKLSLDTQRINDMLLIGDSTYFATDRGLELRSKSTSITFNESNGLQNERINSLTYADYKIYLATQSGFSVINDKEILNFSKSFGLQSSSINKITKVDNQIWLAGNNGISVINEKDIKQSTPPKLNIKYKNKSFSYNVISFINDGSINIQYKINDYDWIELSKLKDILSFESYKDGNYDVVFRTRNGNSKWIYSDNYSFAIPPPWYRVWWIILLLVLGTSGIVALIFNFRLKAESKRSDELQKEINKRIEAEQELNEVRDNIARDFHDDLGNKLSSISLLSEVLSKKIDAKESDIVNTIKDDANYLYKGTKDFIFSLQEKSNYLEELIMYLTDFSEDYLFQFGIDFEISSSVEKNIKLPHYWSKQIIYIFKEAITNSVKHANATTVVMSFEYVMGVLIIICSDDGKGFDEENVIKNGLQNMCDRAKKINCNLMINSDKSKGTKIIFEGKLP